MVRNFTSQKSPKKSPNGFLGKNRQISGFIAKIFCKNRQKLAKKLMIFENRQKVAKNRQNRQTFLIAKSFSKIARFELLAIKSPNLATLVKKF